MVTNALVIAFTSDFIERAVYLLHYAYNPEQDIRNENEFGWLNVNTTTQADKYAAFIFSFFKTSDYPADQLGFSLHDMQ